MWLVVGLGNPGPKYERNRHNIGFRVVDELARKHGLPAWKTAKGGETTTGIVTTERGREKALLLKPMEFMNLSGFAVQRTAAFHHVEPDHVLVVHDEIDLDFGIVRLKNGGGHGGHNGLRDIIAAIGSNDFLRVRVGIGRPPGRQSAADFVLHDFTSAERAVLPNVLVEAADAQEQNSHRAHLGQPVGLARHQTIGDCAGDMGA